MARSSKVAVAKFAWSGRERLGMLRVRDDVIVLHQLLWPDEIRDPGVVDPPSVEVSEDEVDGALALIDTMTREDLEGPEFRDTYTEDLEQIVEAKREHRVLPEASEPERAPGKVVDLMAALQESVSKARSSRGENGDDADVHELPRKKTAKKQPARKTTAKKTTTKTAAKKAAAKKTTAKRPRRAS
ncbi:Ku protein [Streptomyces sp. NPDC026672]|uniref:Ku protein n=1 Tax=unclassified Streptomyces TaxID=2593676 RepID=UPI0033E9A8C8